MEPYQRTPTQLDILFCERPLRLVTVPDRAMEPELFAGQQVFVQAFRPHVANYMEQRFALRYRGRIIIRRLAFGIVDADNVLIEHGYRLFGNREGQKLGEPGVIELPWIDDWRPPDDWMSSGVIHPECTAIGPILTGTEYDADAGRKVTRCVTHSWSN